MTPEEQEALSHQHSHGVWIVAIDSARCFSGWSLAVFDHPNGHLLKIIHEVDVSRAIRAECLDAAVRYKSRDVPRPLPASLDLGEMEIDL